MDRDSKVGIAAGAVWGCLVAMFTLAICGGITVG